MDEKKNQSLLYQTIFILSDFILTKENIQINTEYNLQVLPSFPYFAKIKIPIQNEIPPMLKITYFQNQTISLKKYSLNYCVFLSNVQKKKPHLEDYKILYSNILNQPAQQSDFKTSIKIIKTLLKQQNRFYNFAQFFLLASLRISDELTAKYINLLCQYRCNGKRRKAAHLLEYSTCLFQFLIQANVLDAMKSYGILFNVFKQTIDLVLEDLKNADLYGPYSAILSYYFELIITNISTPQQFLSEICSHSPLPIDFPKYQDMKHTGRFLPENLSFIETAMMNKILSSCIIGYSILIHNNLKDIIKGNKITSDVLAKSLYFKSQTSKNLELNQKFLEVLSCCIVQNDSHNLDKFKESLFQNIFFQNISNTSVQQLKIEINNIVQEFRKS